MRSFLVIPLAALSVSGFLWWFSQGRNAAVSREAESSEPILAPVASAEINTPAIEDASTIPATISHIRIPSCSLLPIQEQSVASQIDGLIQAIEVVPGQKVKKGQVLARLDDGKLVPQIQILEIRANSKSEELIAQAQFKEADAKVKYAEAANQRDPRAVPELEYKSYLAQRERFEQEINKAREDRQAAQKELEKLRVIQGLHQITSVMDGEVVKVHKREGETIKQAELLFAIARTDRLRIEGFVKAHQAASLRAGMTVQVEPDLQGVSQREMIGHTESIIDLAISQDGKVIVSASLDNTAIIWSWPTGTRLGTLPHSGTVLAVDVARLASSEADPQYFILTGCEDGKVRGWTLTRNRVEGPVWTTTAHDGAVRCLRFDEEKQAFASGGADRKCGVWERHTGKNLQWLCTPGAWKQSAHQGAVTDVHFGRDGLVYTHGTDNVIRVWSRMSADVAMVKEHRGRTGDVSRLGASPDGTSLLFDHADELRLIHPRNGHVTGVLNTGKGVSFQGFATFSPSGRLILSYSADGRCQLWQTPGRSSDKSAETGVGGNEIRHYRLPRSLEMKCGIFAPDESVFFSGGTDRTVRAWVIPPRSEWQPRQARITLLGSTIEPGTDLIRIHAEVDNDDARTPLWPGAFVNVKAQPSLSE